MKKTRFALFQSVICLMLCFSMLIGTTFAWFTDTVTSAQNVLAAGSLDVELEYRDDAGVWHPVTEQTNVFDPNTLWEPGHTEVVYLRISNQGDLALNYRFGVNIVSEQGSVNQAGDPFKLSQFIHFGALESDAQVTYATRDQARSALTESWVISQAYTDGDPLYPVNNPDGLPTEKFVTLVVYMPEDVKNEANYATGAPIPKINLGIQLVATQQTYESDSFGTDYDNGAEMPEFPFPVGGIADSATGSVVADGEGKVSETVQLQGSQSSATIPEGVQLEQGASEVTLTVNSMAQTGSNLQLEENQEMTSLDVHVAGVAADNTVPMVIQLVGVLPVGLNQGNYALHHVENGVTNPMTAVATAADVKNHNEFYYDPATGNVTVALASFSEIAVIAEPAKWEGNFDYSWYSNAVAPVDGEGEADYVIANADQLAGLSAIVGGMNGQAQDSFSGKIIKLISDINLGDKESENNPDIIFYPIGYNSSDGKYEKTGVAVTTGFYNFCGTFDGNGHTISNFYQNTWEMKGDHNWYDATLQYYRDGMGLFGKVYGGTVKNLTVSNFSSDGEIATTGVIAAYADGATFENIAIFDCNPRVYNIGNGGIVGCVGWYAKEANLKTTFKNITVDNSNKISALWGSYDVACGGIVGQYYPTSGQTSAGTPKNAGIHFENCHISAVMDVYNDVCANYQYYAYRYTGMLIGSVRENETIDGHVYPKMDKITASNCTVHFGDWNDYYYCEIIDNTTASYTHDYQMSRLTEIKAIDGTTITYLDGTTGTVPASGRANYVIVDYTKGHGTENATCYHFKDGAVWTHDMGGIQTGIDENGDGQDDLKEDKQHIYLEFNNLVTGYGWGVTSKGLTDYEGVENMDITQGDHEASVEKFEGKVATLANATEIKLGDIFRFVDNGVELVPGALTVTVTNLDDNNPVSATIVYNRTTWENSTITFTGTGKVQITIQDYYFCTPTTIEVNIAARQNAEKFDIVMNNGDFLHRVGNSGTVALSKLFKAKDGATIGTVDVTVEAVGGTAASGTYTSNATWTDGTIQFSGTGVVKVTIKDDDTYCTPTELYLEVVDAVNATTATNATSNNVVLLNDIDANSLSIKDGFAFYGNGFKVKFAGDGSYRSAAVSYGFVTIENGGVLDNAQIICKIFPKAYMFTDEMEAGSDGRYPYGYSAVVVSGNSTISNCYVYGARNNIQVGNGNVTIQNTVTECGSLSNIHIKSVSGNTVVLDNITTIQRQVTDDFNLGNTMLGFGILVGDNETTAYPCIKITGDLRQYNWVSQADADKVSNTYAKQAINGAVTNKDYQHTFDGVSKVNFGIVFLTTNTANIQDSRTDSVKQQVPYLLSEISISIYKGQVYSVKAGSQVTEDSRYDAETDGVIPYTPSAQKVIAPQVSHSGVSDNSLTINTAYNNAWITTFTADLDNITGGSYSFRFNDLVIKKYGKELSFTVKDSSGNTVDKATVITLNQLYTGEYTLIVTDDAIYNSNGQLSGETVTHEMPFVLYATKTSIDPPKFEGIGSGVDGAIRLVSTTGGNWRPAYPALEGVSVTYWSASEGKMMTVDLTTLTNEGTINGQTWTYTCDDFTLKITGGPVHTTTSYVLSPMIATRDGEPILYFAGANKDNSTGTTARLICLEYVFTDKNASTTVGQCTKYGDGIATVQYANLQEFSWSSFQKGTVEEVSSGGAVDPCFTADTLITLADGTQKRIDELTFEDKILAWDFFAGNYVVKDVAIIVNHGEADNHIANMLMSDGTVLRIVGEHGVFDYDLNKFVYITPENVADFVGHRFVQYNPDGSYNVVTMVDGYATQEYCGFYSVSSAGTSNAFASGLLTVAPPEDFYNWIEMGDKLMYDAEQFRKDVETYGLYTYEDFADYVTYEQFVDWNGAYLKIAVEKGYFTFDYILELIELYKGWMPG